MYIYIYKYICIYIYIFYLSIFVLILIYNICCSDKVPLHFSSLHILVSNGCPWHLSPPKSGEGLLHNLVLDLFPPLQGLPHIDHIVQSFQLPCTIKSTA